MDLIIYCVIVAIVGMLRVNSTKNVPASMGVAGIGVTVTADCALPIAENLALEKEYSAYTLILEELGLKTHA